MKLLLLVSHDFGPPTQSGVIRTRVGYAGGTKKNPTYRSIGDYTESIQVDYDPEKTTYKELVQVFYDEHSPSRSSKQYQSAIFYHDDDQKEIALQGKEDFEKRVGSTAVLIQRIGDFYLAEDYHQKFYLRQNSDVLKELNLDNEALINSPIATRFNCYVSGRGDYEEAKKDVANLNLSEGVSKRILNRLK
ncbi:peptide methionine sulfoxide reductase [Acrasis kona]|uniref:peptide-methionine (S)-S-oxide reductase n=1 Tax=Acrasis kona TaxID=1008807 RepID=A0AAW2ZQW7_9EUKA